MRNKKNYSSAFSFTLLGSVLEFGTKVLLVIPVIKDDEVLILAEPVLPDDEVVAASFESIVSQAFLIILDVGVRGVGIRER